MKIVFLAGGAFCLAVAVGVLCTNPRRLTNQVFLLLSLLISCWMWSVAGAMHAAQGGFGQPAQWLKINGSVSGGIAWVIWMLKEAIVSEKFGKRYVLRRTLLPFLVFSTFSFLALFTDLYIPGTSTTRNETRGGLYSTCIVTWLVWTAAIFTQSMRQLRQYNGLKRIELLFLCGNITATCFLAIMVTTAGNWLGLSWLRQISVFVFLISFILAGWALTFHRTYNARQIFLSLSQRLFLIASGAAIAIAAYSLITPVAPSAVAVFISACVAIILIFWLDRRTRIWLRLDSEQAIAALRRRIIATARTEADVASLCKAFEAELCDDFSSDHAEILQDRGGGLYRGRQLELSARAIRPMLRDDGWTTPEKIGRRRMPDVNELERFIVGNDIGVVVAAPAGSAVPSLLIAVKKKSDGWPFTYPEVQRLLNVAEMIDNVLTRSRLTEQAALQAKMEHLAMMSRGLAHDLKNLITPISSYLVHLDGRHEPGSAEQEVHAAARRSVRIMTEYVREALFFANRLTPKFETTSLRQIFDAAVEIARPRAERGGIFLLTRLDETPPLVADAVLIQRLLVNLLSNAIDASPAGAEVVLSGTTAHPGWVHIEVIDRGSGIPVELLGRIFEPYFTTKQFGDEVRGFGLGLTICQKIVELHEGTIVVRSAVGGGTTVRVDLPRDRPNSLPPAAAQPAGAAHAG